MDRDSIKEFLESRYKELSQNEILPPLKNKEQEKEIIEEIPKTKKSKLKKVIYALVSLSILFGGVFFGYEVYGRWYIKQADQSEVLLKRVGLLTDLPIGETPTIATVTNAEAIKGQAFFKEVEVGDKVLIFDEAKKAILYRPSTDKVVSIAPLN